MKRRVFLKRAFAAAVGMSASRAYALTFDEYRQQQKALFDDYQAKFRAAELVYRQEVKQFWSDAELSSARVFVRYTPDLSVRSKVDFESGRITIEAQAGSPAAAGNKIRLEVEKLLQLDTRSAYEEDGVLQLVDKETLTANASQLKQELVVGDLFHGRSAEEVLEPAEKSIAEDLRPVAKVVIELPKGSAAEKAQRYQPLAEQFASQQKVSSALVMAVMHTESHFNPMARSHIPAFGLMQIVPESAGLDTTAYLNGTPRVMTAAELYRPEVNIESGAAYLHLLYYRYLKGVDNPLSRFYCVIAAYNTGAGNVARAFTGKGHIGEAAQKINRLQPQQVYRHLRQHLPYQETRDYLEKVTKRIEVYR